MKSNYFGQDGFVWWQGVVENRHDPLKLGRCQVRIFGWHSPNIEEQNTLSLPWAHPVIPIDAGKNTVGPKEGEWVFGFFADAHVGQRPMILGVIPTIPEEVGSHPDEKRGYTDLRPDDLLKGHQVPRQAPDMNNIQSQGGDGTTITEYAEKSRYPDSKFLREPHTSRYARGFSEGIIVRTSDYKPKKEAKEKELKDNPPKPRPFTQDEYNLKSSLNNLDEKAQEIVQHPMGKQETIPARDKEEKPAIELGSVLYQTRDGDTAYSAAGTVLWEQAGEIFLVDVFGTFEEGPIHGLDFAGTAESIIPQPMGHLYRSMLRPKILSTIQQKYTPIAEHIAGEGEFAVFKEQLGGSFSEPLTSYSAKYPYNHVYESESGHLLEFDDTPGFERIQLYHRSGSFEEVHPTGLRVKKTVNDSYNYNLKNEFLHTTGKGYQTFDKGLKVLVNRDGGLENHYNILVGEGSNLNITTADGQVNIWSGKEVQIFCDADVNVDCENAKVHSRADTIIHTEGDADWHVEGNMKLQVDGDFVQVVDGEKKTTVGNSYNKSVAEDYNSVVSGKILEVSGSSNITQATSTIMEISAGANLRTCASSIVDTGSNYFNFSVGNNFAACAGTNTTMAGNSITEMSNVNLEISSSKLTTTVTNTSVSSIDLNLSGAILIAAAAVSQFGFITSNTIVHGSGYV